MWEILAPALFIILKEHFDNIIMRITTWFLLFVLCWLYIPVNVQIELMAKPLPALPDYILVYFFYLSITTVLWLAFFIILDVLGLIIKTLGNRKIIALAK
ncbi:hypothetical protein [Pasteurella multocida]|uniref:hypothetical protein n=1 Tax=Pasteurella multocida TaxID=747 RepID=UPI002B472D13|nr:hypothetical protein [Pasteurella multocida]WRK03704.1 hypothetical protein RFF39_03385 [Pasteurella multocida]HDR1800317.1 hypothetical protein [Pasteurella multocida]